MYGNTYSFLFLLQTYRHTNGLIVTQTPLPNTVVDFLRLLWDNQVKTIVMMDTDISKSNVKIKQNATA